jgi:hypothetical protein
VAWVGGTGGANTAKAIEWDLMPWDGARTATAANGGSMAVHGVANGVEVYMDGHRLVVDFLIADLGGRFGFLLGYDFMRHYSAHRGARMSHDADEPAEPSDPPPPLSTIPRQTGGIDTYVDV